MPWKVYKQGDEYCIHKQDGDKMGERVAGGCHASESKANRHMRALYAAEGRGEMKETDFEFVKALVDAMDEEPAECKSCDELDSIVTGIRDVLDSGSADAADSVKALADEYLHRKAAPPAATADATSTTDDEEPKGSKGSIFQKVKELVFQLTAWINGEDESEPEGASEPVDKAKSTGFMVYKDTRSGEHRWIGRYSNNFRDNDNPPEIISAASHKRFAELVDKGFAPLPDLWIWHVKNWNIGKADWVAYDDSGFALAGGTFHPGLDEIVETLASKENLAMSHGMPHGTVRYDPNDPSIIVEHETREVSVLPQWAAANKLTGFVVIDHIKEDSMAIPEEKRKKLIDEMGFTPQMLAALEQVDSQDAAKAADAGLQSKEATPAAEVTEPPADQTPAATEPASAEPQAVAAAFIAALQPLVERVAAVDERIAALEGQVKELNQSETDRIAKAANATPWASVAAILSGAQSAIGAPETKQDGRESLAKSKPAETRPETTARTGIPFIDELVARQAAQQQ